MANHCEVIVADNGSTDDSAAVARDKGATVLSLPGLRLGALRNQAAAAASGELLAFVDADHEIVSTWIQVAQEVMRDEQIGAAGADCYPPDSPTWVQRTYDLLRRHSGTQHEVHWLGSGNMVVRKSLFDRTGGFDESLNTCEDVDLCRKLRSVGARMISDPRLRNIHYGDPETLRNVFLGELWRGVDNVRVSLRPPQSLRSLISAALPVVELLMVAIVLVGLLTLTKWGAAVAALAAAFLLAIVAARTTAMLKGGRGVPVHQALSVAAAYEAGRALALVSRAQYGRRRKGAVA